MIRQHKPLAENLLGAGEQISHLISSQNCKQN